MQVNMRGEQRSRCRKSYSISWQDTDGVTHSAAAQGVDVSRSGVGIRSTAEVQPGIKVYIQDHENHLAGYGVVRHCTRRQDDYSIGIELNEEAKKASALTDHEGTTYYEFLQISPNAEAETIHRIFRFLAGRYHPDNPATGDPEKFLLLNRAFEVLSNPERRAEYDATLRGKPEAIPEFESLDYMDGVEGEVNRRLAVLSLLYRRCRTNVDNPIVSLPEMEAMMEFPREYLDFTMWYLKSKKYITRKDNSDFALTVLGVDYVEANYSKLPVLRKLLNAGSGDSSGPEGDYGEKGHDQQDEGHILGPAEALMEDGQADVA
jgi:curved DNA-binding protein